MNFNETVKLYREIPETARVGLKWTEEEDKQLMKEVIDDGMNLEDIAKKHQRTLIGVKMRAMTNALVMMEEKNLSMQELAKMVRISAEDLEIWKEKQERKNMSLKEREERKEEMLKKREEKREELKVNRMSSKKEKEQEELIFRKELMNIFMEIRDYLKIIAEK
jgi:hypothetical protein